MSDAETCGDMRICLGEEQPFAAIVRGGRMVKREFVLGTSDILRRSACHAHKLTCGEMQLFGGPASPFCTT